MKLDPKQVRRYYETRLPGQRLHGGVQVKVRCPFHDDPGPSLSLNLERGVWKCFGCNIGGSLLAFEMRLSECDEATAKANISELLGVHFSGSSQKPEATYKYHDALGRLVFEKLRMPGKQFRLRKPTAKGGWDYKLGDIKKPLYRLPEVLVANEIFICEGEKDVDNVHALNLGDHVAATTNFDGAGKWRDEYAQFFAGKRVAILPDNDEPGRKHAEKVAQSLYGIAAGIKIAALPDLPDKGDVSDYLQKHSAADLAGEVVKAPQWHPALEDDNGLLVPATVFINTLPESVDWMIEGVIERGANGFFCAVPKGGKSWAASDMAVSLAIGAPWFGFKVPQPVVTALITREDNPSLTGWRMRHLWAGKEGGDPGLLEKNLYINSRAQSDELMLDNAEQVADLVQALQRRKVEFAIFDVFNILHSADENDNTEMRVVLRQLSAIQAKAGCAIGMVHHYSKAESGSMTQRLRGASAIAGWAEWLIGITMADEERKVRRMDFELKAAQPPEAVYYRIDSDPNSGVARLSPESSEMAGGGGRKNRALEIMGGGVR